MKVIIPMAGRGTRLRPHTLTLPKPLLKLAGKSMIEWIVEEIKSSSTEDIEEIHFIIGDFGAEVESMLINTADKIGCKGFIHYQHEALGTGHAIYCARTALDGSVFIVFADTIFKGKIEIDNSVDGIIWTMAVDDPEKYGVVKKTDDLIITDFIEKPKEFVSNNAIVGLYYFKDASKLRHEIVSLIDNDEKENNEYQLTNVLETLKVKGNLLKCAEIQEWLDCGNKSELLKTHNRLLELNYPDSLQYIDNSALLKNSVIDAGVSIEEGTIIENSTITNSIIYSNSVIRNSTIKDSIIGNNTKVSNLNGTTFLGDYSEYEGN